MSWWWPGDKEAMTYTAWDWASSQPNNRDGIEDRISVKDGKWWDERANNENRFICTKKANPGLMHINFWLLKP